MATVRHRRWWASTARLWPRRSGSAARGTEREQILVVDVADASFMMPLSMEETPPAPPSTGMGSSARSCGRPRLPSSGDRGRSDCPSCRSRGNACCAVIYSKILLIRVHSAFVELPQEAFRQVPLRGSSRPPSTCLCQVLFFLMRQVPFGSCVPCADRNKNIIYPHMTEICGYSLVTVFLMKVR